MTRKHPSPDRLRQFAEEHLLYEAGMLYEMTRKLMNRHHEDEPILENALLESFGVHSRCLIDFLWREKPMWDTDAIASDWVKNWQAPSMSRRLEGVNDRVGREMFHLSFNRLDIPEGKKGWRVLGIGPEVIGAFVKFASEVPDDLIPEGWRDAALSATGSVPPERLEELKQHVISVADLRPGDLPAIPTQMLSPDRNA